MQIICQDTLITYKQLGTGAKHLVILHGWGQSLNHWIPITSRLIDNYTITLVDLPGFGGSEEPRAVWDIYQYTKCVEEFLQKKNISVCTIIGHSFGGRIATILAAQNAKQIEKLILIDSGGIEIKGIKTKIKICITKILSPFKKIIPQKIKNIFGSTDYKAASPTMRKIFAKIVNQDLRYLFTKIATPTFVLWGQFDTELPVCYTKIYKRLIPKSVIRIIWEAGHNPHITAQKQLLDILNEIL